MPQILYSNIQMPQMCMYILQNERYILGKVYVIILRIYSENL